MLEMFFMLGVWVGAIVAICMLISLGFLIYIMVGTEVRILIKELKERNK